MSIFATVLAVVCAFSAIMSVILFEYFLEIVNSVLTSILTIGTGLVLAYIILAILFHFVSTKYNLHEEFWRDFWATPVRIQLKYFAWLVASFILFEVIIHSFGMIAPFRADVGYVGFLIIFFGVQARPNMLSLLENRDEIIH